VSEILSVDPIWKLDLMVLAEREKFNQEGAANAMMMIDLVQLDRAPAGVSRTRLEEAHRDGR